MVTLVYPVFYERGRFDPSANTEQARIIQRKYIYKIREFDRNGYPLGPINEFITNNEGKLHVMASPPPEQRLVPLAAGACHFFVSKYKMPEPALKINRANSVSVNITEKFDQRIYLP